MNDVAEPQSRTRPARSLPGEPTWEVAHLFPAQGRWSESEYLALKTNHLVELVDGFLAVLPVPLPYHQLIVAFLYEMLQGFVRQRDLGHVFFAPLPVRIGAGTYREPDVVYLQPGRLKSLRTSPEGADLVMEVVSEGRENRDRDLLDKRADYAGAGIAEYWIVDPELGKISVLTLEDGTYRVHGEFHAGSTATSKLLSGFSVAVDQVFNVGDSLPGMSGPALAPE